MRILPRIKRSLWENQVIKSVIFGFSLNKYTSDSISNSVIICCGFCKGILAFKRVREEVLQRRVLSWGIAEKSATLSLNWVYRDWKLINQVVGGSASILSLLSGLIHRESSKGKYLIPKWDLVSTYCKGAVCGKEVNSLSIQSKERKKSIVADRVLWRLQALRQQSFSINNQFFSREWRLLFGAEISYKSRFSVVLGTEST